MLLRRRIAAHARAGRNVFRSMRVQDAGAGRIELQSVVGALDAIAIDDLSHVQGRESMRAAVLQRGNVSVRFSVENDRLFQNGAAEQLTVGEIIGPGGDIPRVAEIGSADHLLFALAKLEVRCERHRPSSISTTNRAEVLRRSRDSGPARSRECAGLSFGPSPRVKPRALLPPAALGCHGAR